MSRPLFYRKSSVDMTATDWQTFINACSKVGFATFTNVHSSRAEHSMGRPNPLFLPWHRELIAAFERALHAVDPTVVVPYWDMTASGLPSPLANFPASVRRQLGRDGGAPTRSMIDAAFSQRTFLDFSSVLENQYHNRGHVYIGGDMSQMSTSPSDILFYLHHCMCDRLWYQWQLQGNNQGAADPSTRLDLGSLGSTTVGAVESISVMGYAYLAPGEAAPLPVAPPRPVPAPRPTWQEPAPGRPPISSRPPPRTMPAPVPIRPVPAPSRSPPSRPAPSRPAAPTFWQMPGVASTTEFVWKGESSVPGPRVCKCGRPEGHGRSS